ncbi:MULTISPECIES: biotin/lipoate A/B protein ligase family protein [Metallosphaera]|uniref:Biotin/lipoate A/B protein ligase n=3 Tax=Metallosphaera TaxID=41980 RepID=A4YGW1_METS5|nr:MULTISPECIES: biotin/lipoate A/B protein ligase family protein [Metallosphaera]ABP95663.1 biotin/lipoate A/B protein ligase [Metallosphaera sedula DSM 5348]AIM27647.1 biotin/lipoate A/B protein ligase [Metallosphaera sedula]AKV74504.1 biotin--protein ligase [Metallosphaera sedula]AKV76743.1 biotin--protein ligase [Metallosphaera sedula]AKV78994.1 biotin--protein ligase [Metallosphaera sedula]
MRLVVEGGAPGERQMALDEATLLLLNQGVVDEMIRFWNFSPTTLSIGRFLSVHDWVNMDLLQQKKIPLIRRFTGGGPALHDELGEITWSVAVRSHEMMAVYRRIGEAIVMALKQLGLTGEFVPINDVVVKDKKVVGMAGAQKGNAVLVHGTFMFATDLSLMSVIKVPKPKELVRGTPSSRVSNLSLLLNRKVSREEALNALLSGFLSVFEAEKGELTPLEIELSKQLSYKYTNDKWTFVR